MSEVTALQGSKSNPLLILLSIKKIPVMFKRIPKFFKKIEANFVTGVLIGAIFSLLVNIITNQVGESISRQKSLEALEIEIADHHQMNSQMVNYYKTGEYKKNNMHGYFEHKYMDNIWRSLASTTFFYSLPPKTQGELLSYYGPIISSVNSTLSNDDQMVRNYHDIYAECSFGGGQCNKELDMYNKVADFYTQDQDYWGIFVDKYDFELSKYFHPTLDRLNNPILSFLMGKEALKSLILPWK